MELKNESPKKVKGLSTASLRSTKSSRLSGLIMEAFASGMPTTGNAEKISDSTRKE